MECWVPLFNIFLSSPCPESEASLWLQQSFNPSSSTTTDSFLSLLSKPSDAIVPHSSPPSPSSSPHTKRVMWIQTLPNAVQSRILSFLAFEHKRFCERDLTRLAGNILSENLEIDFWVKKAAHQLLDVLSNSNYEWVSSLNLDSEEERVSLDLDLEFEAMPDWLKDAAIANDSVLPWLPISRDELNSTMPFDTSADDENLSIEVEECEEENENEVSVFHPKTDPLDPEIEKKAAIMKTQILNFESPSKTVALANEIRQLCIETRDSLTVLRFIEPWKADDETASILISHLSDGNEEELDWPSRVLCSVVLPKLLALTEPASRVLVSATIEYCKLHQRAAVYALLWPLFLRSGGINKPICDVIMRIMKESLHPAHVSAFCQKLLCGEEDPKEFICLPLHQVLLSNELVWSESLFNLFQNILNHNVHLTQDSVDQLVNRVRELADGFSKSLIFGKFLLCLVNKCAPLLESHKLSLTEAVEETDTLVTKSLLSKLASL